MVTAILTPMAAVTILAVLEASECVQYMLSRIRNALARVYMIAAVHNKGLAYLPNFHLQFYHKKKWVQKFAARCNWI